LLQLTVMYVTPDIFIKYRAYIFYSFSALVHGMTVFEPLIKVLFYELQSKNKKV